MFEQLAMPLFDRLYNFARWLTQNRDEAEDLVQETYVKALKGFSSFSVGTNFRAWIFRILRNTFLNSRTGLKAATVSLEQQDDPALPVDNETPETILIDRTASACFRSYRRAAGPVSRGSAVVRGGRDVLPGDCNDLDDPDRHCDVAIVAGSACSSRSGKEKAEQEFVMTHGSWLAQLDSYLDGELESEPMQALDQHLRVCPACAAESLRRLQWKRMTQVAGRRHQPDSGLRERVQKNLSRGRSGRFSWRWATAVTVAAVALAMAGWGVISQQRRLAKQDNIVSELADLYVATLASASPVDVVSTDRHTVKPWFEGKIPFSFNLPELEGTRFELLGARVSYLEQSPGAELIYRVRKHQISVFIFQDRGTGLRRSESREARSFHLESWTQGGLRYFVIGDSGPEDLRALRELFNKAS